MTTMAAIHERRVSSAAQWAKWLASFSLVLLCTASIGHRYAMVETLPFIWVLALVAGLAVLALLLAIVGFSRLWSRGDKAGKASLAAVLVSALVLSPFAVAGYFSLHYPALVDISTDLAEPPLFIHAQRLRGDGMNPITRISVEAAALQREAYPDVNGRRFDAPIEMVLPAAQSVIAANGWKMLSRLPDNWVENGEVSMEMEAPTFLVRFPADAVVRLTDEGESTFVDVRMSSRYGPHDLGSNARRIRTFMNELDAEFTRQSLNIIDIPASSEEENAVE